MQAFSQALLNYFSQVRPTAAIFPVVLIGLIVAFFIKYKREMSPRMGTLEWIQNFRWMAKATPWSERICSPF